MLCKEVKKKSLKNCIKKVLNFYQIPNKPLQWECCRFAVRIPGFICVFTHLISKEELVKLGFQVLAFCWFYEFHETYSPDSKINELKQIWRSALLLGPNVEDIMKINCNINEADFVTLHELLQCLHYFCWINKYINTFFVSKKQHFKWKYWQKMKNLNRQNMRNRI